jgi:hypothetical protein
MSFYTNDRVNDFSNRYQQYVEKLKGESDKSGDSAFKFYNFIQAPDAIKLIDIGSCKSNDILALRTSNNSNALWQSLSREDTPQAWKMQLGKKLSEYKRAEAGLSKDPSKITKKTPGLIYKITYLPRNPEDIKPNDINKKEFINNFKDVGILSNTAFLDKCIEKYYGEHSTAWIDRFLKSENVKSSGNTIDFSEYNKLTISSNKDNDESAIGVEWYGFFKPSAGLGEYKFEINSGNGFCLLWIGNKAICEYIPTNADINTKSNPFTIIVAEDRYYPIRIQYYANSNKNADAKDNREFSFKITKMSTLTQLSLTECLFTLNDGGYIPKLRYCSFVSRSVENFRVGKFDCYSMNEDFNQLSNDDYIKFYDFMNKNKYSFSIKQHDHDNISGVRQFGTLKDEVNYTDVSVSTNPNSKPDIFYIYRLDSDIRMNSQFQINTKPTNETLPYEMSIMKTDFNKGSSYETFPNYYPNNPSDGVNVLGPNECQRLCNDRKEKDCNFFYTYQSNKIPRCVIGTENKQPVFTQIRPVGSNANQSVDEGTSSLNIRTLNFPKVEGCGDNAVFVNDEQDIQNTIDYSNSFAYSNYTLSSNPITSHNAVGKCATSDFLNLENEARNILYSKTDYQSDGQYKHPDGKMRKANYPSTDDRTFWNSIKLEGMRMREGLDTKNANAISDTQDGVGDILSKEQRFAATQMSINKNLYDLSNNLIPTYLDQRTKMNDNVNSDLSGNALLYFRNQRIPTLREQTAFDANEGSFMQNSLYVLGTMTAVSMLILAILIARE